MMTPPPQRLHGQTKYFSYDSRKNIHFKRIKQVTLTPKQIIWVTTSGIITIAKGNMTRYPPPPHSKVDPIAKAKPGLDKTQQEGYLSRLRGSLLLLVDKL